MRQTREISVYVHELIDTDLEGFLDLINDRGWPNNLIGDIDYKLIRSHSGEHSGMDEITFSVTADIVSERS